MNKGSGTGTGTGTAAQANPVECCMCGDAGFSQELFQCKVCHFRRQHRYCSNLYPKAEDCRICNWCLSQKEDSKQKSPNSSNSSSSCRTSTSGDDEKTKNGKGITISSPENRGGGKKGQQLSINHAIKKKRFPEAESSPPPITISSRKRIITNRRLEEKLLRTKSEEIPNRSVITKPVYKSKVRRYKLLEEVSS